MLSKKELRKAMNDRLHQLTEGEKAAASAAVCARLAALPQYQQARSIMAFLHMPDEVSLDGLIQQALADAGTGGLRCLWHPDGTAGQPAHRSR